MVWIMSEVITLWRKHWVWWIYLVMGVQALWEFKDVAPITWMHWNSKLLWDREEHTVRSRSSLTANGHSVLAHKIHLRIIITLSQQHVNPIAKKSFSSSLEKAYLQKRKMNLSPSLWRSFCANSQILPKYPYIHRFSIVFARVVVGPHICWFIIIFVWLMYICS